METRTTAVVGGVQRLETQQGTRGLTDGGRLRRGDTGQASLAQAADGTHLQAQGRIAGQFDGGMAQVHVTRDGQASTGLTQACSVQAIALQQRCGLDTALLQGFTKALDKTD
ncbi:hypothetical protein D3C78_692930 [compost metagenome]